LNTLRKHNVHTVENAERLWHALHDL
jgi:hypothetical protein